MRENNKTIFISISFCIEFSKEKNFQNENIQEKHPKGAVLKSLVLKILHYFSAAFFLMR